MKLTYSLSVTGLARLERCTRFWPMVISETLLCNLMQVSESFLEVTDFYMRHIYIRRGENIKSLGLPSTHIPGSIEKGLKYRTVPYHNANNTTWKYCTVAFHRIFTLHGLIHRQKTYTHPITRRTTLHETISQ